MKEDKEEKKEKSNKKQNQSILKDIRMFLFQNMNSNVELKIEIKRKMTIKILKINHSCFYIKLNN